MRIRSTLRSIFFWTHLGLGLSAGLLILLMSVTGVMLGFERQMIAWIDGAPRVVPRATPVLAVDTALTRAGIPRESVASIVLRRDPTQPTTVRFRERGAAPRQLDPYTGDTLVPSGSGKGQAFFSALRRWHRWVGAQGTELRAQMKVLAGTANLIFLALVLSGLYLWWPRHWSRSRLKATVVPQWHRAGRVRDFNWHNSLGCWFAIPLALIIASGAFISFRWPGQWLDLALGSAQEQAAARESVRESVRAPAAEVAPSRPSTASRAALQAHVETAVRAHPHWAQLTITLPEDAQDPTRIAVAEGNTFRPDLRWTLTTDPLTGAARAEHGYADLSPARKIRAWVRFGHTGEVFGVFGQLLATLASAVGVLLVWTGFTLAWRRLAQWMKHRRRSVPAVTPLPDATL